MRKARRLIPIVAALAALPLLASANQEELQYCEDLKSIVETQCTAGTPIARAKCVTSAFKEDHRGCSREDLSTRGSILSCVDKFGREFNNYCVTGNPVKLAAEQELSSLLGLIEEKFLTEQGPLKAQLAHEKMKEEEFQKLADRYLGDLEDRAATTEAEIQRSLGYKSVFQKWTDRLEDLLVEANSISSLGAYQTLFLEIQEIEVASKKELNTYRDRLIKVRAANTELEGQFYSALREFGGASALDGKNLSLNSQFLEGVLEGIKEAKYTLDRHTEFVRTMLAAKRSALVSIANKEEFDATVQDALYLERSQSYLGKINELVAGVTRPERSSFYFTPYQSKIYASATRIVEISAMCERGGNESWHSLGCNMSKLNLRRAQAMLNGYIKNTIVFTIARMTDSENPGQLQADKNMITLALDNGDLENATAIFDVLLKKYGS